MYQYLFYFIWFVVIYDFYNQVNEQDVKTLSISLFHQKLYIVVKTRKNIGL